MKGLSAKTALFMFLKVSPDYLNEKKSPMTNPKKISSMDQACTKTV